VNHETRHQAVLDAHANGGGGTVDREHASAITVAVEATGEILRVAVHDDGIGGADITRGTGLAGLKDRVEALGGQISLGSPPGAGTTLRADLPLTTAHGAPSSQPTGPRLSEPALLAATASGSGQPCRG
jgi:hypothetical protein